jgi:hypothetical protein
MRLHPADGGEEWVKRFARDAGADHQRGHRLERCELGRGPVTLGHEHQRVRDVGGVTTGGQPDGRRANLVDGILQRLPERPRVDQIRSRAERLQGEDADVLVGVLQHAGDRGRRLLVDADRGDRFQGRTPVRRVA